MELDHPAELTDTLKLQEGDNENTLVIMRNVFPADYAELADIPFETQRRSFKLYGKSVTQPREVAFLSDDVPSYTYSTMKYDSLPLSDRLREIMAVVNKKCKGEHPFNAILANKYENEDSYISPHSDNEKDIVSNAVITASFGQPRMFTIRSKAGTPFRRDVLLPAGSIAIMKGVSFQKKYTHAIPKAKGIAARRVSLTFRRHTLLKAAAQAKKD